MDMNASYQHLIKAVFPNAVIVVDCFHIVQHINRNFNQLRVAIMKKFSAKSTEQKTLKRFWKFLLIPNNQLDEKNSFYNYHFCTAPQKLDMKNLTFGVFFNEINL